METPLRPPTRFDRFCSWYGNTVEKLYSKEVLLVAMCGGAAYLGARHGLKNQ